jgi:hypothetical protein
MAECVARTPCCPRSCHPGTGRDQPRVYVPRVYVPLRDRLHPENLIQLFRGKPVVAHGNGTENLGIELDLVERHAVMDTKIETLTHRAHLLAKDPHRSLVPGYDAIRHSA